MHCSGKTATYGGCQRMLTMWPAKPTNASIRTAGTRQDVSLETETGSRCPFGGVLFTRITDSPASRPQDGYHNLSTKTTDYEPWKGAPFDLKTGLEPLPDSEDLFEIDEHYLDEMEERKQLFQRMHSEVFASTPEAEPVNMELLQTIAELLPRRYPDRFWREGTMLHNNATGETFEIGQPAADPLKIAARLVQEDLALLAVDPKSNQYKLISGAVLFPMRWSLLQKMGRRLAVIHGPVPFYQQKLRLPVDEFMSSLTCEQPYWRANFGVTDDPALFQALTEKQIFAAKANKLESLQRGHITLDDAQDRLFMRCERQTLSRLPKTKAILFTIRTYVRPLRDYLKKSRADLQRLRDSIDSMPEIWVNYKTMQGVKALTLQLLDERLASEKFAQE